jgi:DNA-binding IclR family transcriptional regulator
VLVTLERHRYVVQNPATGRYRLGPRLGLIAQSAGPRLDLATEAQPYIEQLRERTKEVVHLDVLDRNEVVVIAKLDGLQPVQVMSRVGDRGPAHCISTGKAILAYADPQALVAGGLTRYTEHTHATASSLSRELARIREAGFAVNWGEWRTEARGIAAPVADSTLRVVAALGICTPSTRLTEELVSAAAPAVIDAATRLSVHLGASESELDARRAATLLASTKDQAQPDEAPGPETERQDENPSRQRSA